MLSDFLTGACSCRLFSFAWQRLCSYNLHSPILFIKLYHGHNYEFLYFFFVPPLLFYHQISKVNKTFINNQSAVIVIPTTPIKNSIQCQSKLSIPVRFRIINVDITNSAIVVIILKNFCFLIIFITFSKMLVPLWNRSAWFLVNFFNSYFHCVIVPSHLVSEQP